MDLFHNGFEDSTFPRSHIEHFGYNGFEDSTFLRSQIEHFGLFEGPLPDLCFKMLGPSLHAYIWNG